MKSRSIPSATRAATAALAVALIALLPAAAAAKQPRARAPRAPLACASLTRLQPRTGLVTQVAVVRKRNLPCAQARRVVLRCQRGTLHRGWTASRSGALAWLRRGRRAVALRTVAGPDPRCIRRRLERRPASRGLLTAPGDARPAGQFGPYEGPTVYPRNPKPPYELQYTWSAPVATHSALIPPGAISTVDLTALVRNVAGEVRSVWFEYGTTRDLDTRTARQPAAIVRNGSGAVVAVRLAHLRAGTRYWWRAVANVDDDAGRPQVHEGALGSFVTHPYPAIANPSRPCQSAPKGLGEHEPFELTESLAIVCEPERTFSRGACIPACADFHSGQLRCPADFPRNLNAGSWSFTIPEIGIGVSVNKLVNYWRSNDSNRFLELPGKNGNSEGSDVGPTPGWHKWDVAQWAYPFTPTSTRVEFWINCTEQWGKVIDASSLARGQGRDVASSAAPGRPAELRVSATRDGALDLSWSAPSERSPSGIAGYDVLLIGAKPSEIGRFARAGRPTVFTTATRTRLPAVHVRSILATIPSGYQPYVVVAAVSREGSVGDYVAVSAPRP